jgi:hypothetical protein
MTVDGILSKYRSASRSWEADLMQAAYLLESSPIGTPRRTGRPLGHPDPQRVAARTISAIGMERPRHRGVGDGADSFESFGGTLPISAERRRVSWHHAVRTHSSLCISGGRSKSNALALLRVDIAARSGWCRPFRGPLAPNSNS